MGKHRVIKALILIIVIFFHSFILVPRANATAFEGIIGRIAFRAIPPSVIMGLGSGMSAVIGVSLGVGIGYIIIKSGGITALKNWWNASPGQSSPGPGGYTEYSYGSYHVHIFPNAGVGNWVVMTGGGASCSGLTGDPPSWCPTYVSSGLYGTFALAYTAMTGSGYPGNSPPTTHTDYALELATTQPNFNSTTDVKATPGAAAGLVGGAAIVTSTTMSDADADKFIAASGATTVTDTGTQAGNPSITDNTVTKGDSTTWGLLQQIINYVQNLVGIKTSVDSVKTSTDNLLIGVNQQTAVLDNVGLGINRMAGTMDNVGIAIQSQTSALDNINAGVQSIDNAITMTAATSGSVASRMDALKTAASTKFPFSLAGSLSVASVSGASSYNFTALPLTPSISIPIEPMMGPLHSLFDWIRQLLVWFFWAGTLLAILRRGMEM